MLHKKQNRCFRSTETPTVEVEEVRVYAIIELGEAYGINNIEASPLALGAVLPV